MRFFPDTTEYFTSPLPPAELLRRLQADVQQAQTFRGRVAATEFTISRVIDYRNSMLPRIRGQVAAGPGGGSRVRVHHSLHPALLAFAVFWLGGVGSVALATVGGLVQALWQGEWRALTWPNLIPTGMFVFGLLLFTLPFWAEVRQSRPRLIELLRLAPMGPPNGAPASAELGPFVSQRVL